MQQSQRHLGIETEAVEVGQGMGLGGAGSFGSAGVGDAAGEVTAGVGEQGAAHGVVAGGVAAALGHVAPASRTPCGGGHGGHPGSALRRARPPNTRPNTFRTQTRACIQLMKTLSRNTRKCETPPSG